MIIKGEKAKLREDWLNEEKTMAITASVYEIKDKLLGAHHMLRVVYDGIINKYLICDGYRYVHEDMIEAAIDNYYYPFGRGFRDFNVSRVMHCPKSIFISYIPADSADTADMEDLRRRMAADSYTTQYTYECGYVFSQERSKKASFRDNELFTALGKCRSIENIDNNLPLVQI